PPPPPPPPQHEIIYDYVAPAHYQYDYAVKDSHTGDHKEQWETREGDTVRGAYSLADADGTIRIVEYTADPHNGFNAVVKRVGHPLPPPPQPPTLPPPPPPPPAPHGPLPLPVHP
ncbi:cuticle protein 7-like, partial [Schistocerca piceifrons]